MPADRGVLFIVGLHGGILVVQCISRFNGKSMHPSEFCLLDALFIFLNPPQGVPLRWAPGGIKELHRVGPPRTR